MQTIDFVPQSMKECNQWCLWRKETDKKGKSTKIPYNANCNWYASTKDPKTWSTYANANNKLKSGKYDGLGFVFSKEDNFVFIDLDHCIEDGKPNDFSQDVMKHFAGSYMEVSQSGEGIHIIACGSIPRAIKTPTIEMYNQGRYVAFTGKALNRCEPQEAQEAITSLYERFKPPDKANTKSQTLPHISLSQQEIIDKAATGKGGSRFMALMSGVWESAFPSQSEADLSLANTLAFYTGNDKTVMASIFEQSGLYRSKRKMYLAINKAIHDNNSVYAPEYKTNAAVSANNTSVVEVVNPVLQYLDVDQKLKPLQTIKNVVAILENDENFKGKLRYNTLTYSVWIVGDVPWTRGKKCNIREWNNTDDSQLLSYIEANFGIRVPDKVFHGLVIASHNHSYNPVVDFLESLHWDGQPHIENLLPDYLGVEKNEYSTAVMRVFMLGAIARAYDAGTKFDYVPVLIGGQGIGKSTFLRLLSQSENWFCDNFPTIEGNAGIERLRGMWLIELAELLATKRAKDVEGIKAFITSTVDNYRPPYGRRTEQRPRSCVFFGTTNNMQFLTDRTGNRRFLPLVTNSDNVKKSLFENLDSVNEDFRQAWAEAVAIYKGGDYSLTLPHAIQQFVADTQEQFLEEDSRVGVIEEYLQDKDEVCVLELWQQALDNSDRTPLRRESNELHAIMANSISGWRKMDKKKRFGQYGAQWGYERIRNRDFVQVNDEMQIPFN